MLKNLKLYPIDIITYGYILFKLLYIAIGRNRIENAGRHFLLFTLIAVFSYLIIRFYKPNMGKILTFIRLTYPMFFISYFFNASTIVDRVIFTEYLDPFFQSIDYYIFGYQPAIEWGKKYGHIIIQELFHFAYFSYYIVMIIVALLIYIKKNEYYQEYAFTVIFVFYVCYVTYSILPVIGGRYWEELFQLTMTYRGGLFTRIMAFIYSQSQHTGAAVPSSHVAITVIVNIGAYKYSKKLGLSLIPLTIMVALSTVYCHYHYFIDAVLGVIYALVFYMIAGKLFNYLSCMNRNQKVSPQIHTNEDRQEDE